MTIEIQKRDFEILKLCYEQRFLVKDHLRHFFGTHPSAQYRRLHKLEDADLIKREHIAIFGRNYLLRLTQLGEVLVQEHYGFQLPTLKAPNLNTLSHDALVTSVRMRLSQCWEASFLSERAIQIKKQTEIPDGLFIFRSGKGVALEVECSDKGKTRFLKRLNSWKNLQSIFFTLYVTPHPTLQKTLLRYFHLAPKDTSLGVVLWEELKKGWPKIKTSSGNVDLLSKKEL